MSPIRLPIDPVLVSRVVQITTPTTLAIASLLLTASGAMPWLGLLTAATCVVASRQHGSRHLLGAGVPPRTVLAAGFLVLALPASSPGWVMPVVGSVLLGLLLHEVPLRAVAAPRFRVANLTVPHEAANPDRMMKLVWYTNTGLILAVGLFTVASWPTWPLLVASALAVLLSGAVFGRAWDRRRRRRAEHLGVLHEAVACAQPKFLLHFSAPPGSHYQVQMWLPYLERVGEPFVVVLRESHSLDIISSATKAPVVVCTSLAALDAVMVPSLRAVFYVNNGMKNGHCVRFTHLTHVQLLHGDSDKASSFNPVTAMYDRVFVAGQAGVDRYAANGVEIALEKFRIVGRPQVEDVEVSREAIGDLSDRTVLYAPTWVGYYSDVNFSSLPIGRKIVQQLIERGATVIFRHHPYAKRDRRSTIQIEEIERVLAEDRARNGRPHLWGSEACQDLSFTDCINRSDAMISDVSAVAADYLFSQKPFAIADMADEGEDFPQSFSLARAAYVLRSDATNIVQVLADLLERDPLAATRREMRTYYLGDFPPEHYADAFVEEARRCLDEAPLPGGATVPTQRGSPETVPPRSPGSTPLPSTQSIT